MIFVIWVTSFVCNPGRFGERPLRERAWSTEDPLKWSAPGVGSTDAVLVMSRGENGLDSRREVPGDNNSAACPREPSSTNLPTILKCSSPIPAPIARQW